MREVIGPALGDYRRAGGFRRPFTLFALIGVVLLALLSITGGGIIHPWGHRISIRSAGNPACYFLWILVIRFLSRPRVSWRWFRRNFIDLDPRIRRFTLVFLVPVLLWMLDPLHLKNAIDFLENRDPSKDMARGAGLVFYPRVFLESYSPSLAVGAVVLVFALSAYFLARRATAPVRALLVVLAFQILLPMAHGLKHERYLIVTAPFLWLSAATCFGIMLNRLLSRARPRVRNTLLVLLCAGLGFGVGAAEGPRRKAADLYRGWTRSPSLRVILDDMAGACVGVDGTILLEERALGTDLVAWHCFLTHDHVRESQLPGPDIFPFLDAPALLDAIGERGDMNRVILHLVDDEQDRPSPEGERGAGRLGEFRSRIREDPRFVRRESRRYPNLQSILEVYDRRRP